MIEIVAEHNLEALLPLIRQYQAFYKATEISDETNQQFFAQFGESNPSGCQFLFRKDQHVVGFATVYFSYASTLPAKVAVLNDLYTVPAARSQGVARQLIEHCRSYALSQGAVRLQWLTAVDNEPAQQLYDSMGCKRSNWLFYSYP